MCHIVVRCMYIFSTELSMGVGMCISVWMSSSMISLLERDEETLKLEGKWTPVITLVAPACLYCYGMEKKSEVMWNVCHFSGMSECVCIWLVFSPGFDKNEVCMCIVKLFLLGVYISRYVVLYVLSLFMTLYRSRRNVKMTKNRELGVRFSGWGC